MMDVVPEAKVDDRILPVGHADSCGVARLAATCSLAARFGSGQARVEVLGGTLVSRLPTLWGVALFWSAVLLGTAGGVWLKRGLLGST